MLVSGQLGPLDIGAQHKALNVKVLLQLPHHLFRVVCATVQKNIELSETGRVMKSHPFGQPAASVTLYGANPQPKGVQCRTPSRHERAF
jgi:hypothetical protein